MKICFVCSGNTCRSIMAEHIAKKILKERKIDGITIQSKGLYAKGDNISDYAKLALFNVFQIKAKDRKSIKLKRVDSKTLYICMTRQLQRAITGNVKVLSFADVGLEIPDPYGQELYVYEQTARLLYDAILRIFSILMPNIF